MKKKKKTMMMSRRKKKKMMSRMRRKKKKEYETGSRDWAGWEMGPGRGYWKGLLAPDEAPALARRAINREGSRGRELRKRGRDKKAAAAGRRPRRQRWREKRSDGEREDKNRGGDKGAKELAIEERGCWESG